ncbi:DUF6236 family protein [Serratia fonticola]|uniref:DUF6236 family protein n=1 Tax=Serratia fonticola TaxID=47917 RepID=UPI003AAEA97F
MKRGVVSTEIEIVSIKPGCFRTGNHLSSIDINYFTLYWDKIVIPTNNILRSKIPNEIELMRCGVLERISVDLDEINSETYPKFCVSSQIKIVDELRAQDKTTDWRNHFLGNQVVLPSQDATTMQAVRVELSGLLPVPPAGTPLHEILEFKARRAAELDALHEHLDGIYLEIMASGDINLQRTKSFSRLKDAIADLDKLNDEGWRSPLKFDISTAFEFDLTQVYAGITTALLASQQPNAMVTLGTGTLALLAGFIKVKPVIQSMRKGTDPRLSYLANAHKEGIVGR